MKTNYTIPIILVLTLSTVVLIGKYAGLRVEYLKSEKQKTEYCNKYKASISDKDSIKSSLEEELIHAYNTIDYLTLDNQLLTDELIQIQ